MENTVAHFIAMSTSAHVDSTGTMAIMLNDYFMNEIGEDTCKVSKFAVELKKQIKARDKKNKRYMYMITFTCDPRKIDVKCDFMMKANEEYILDRLKKPGLKLVRLEYVREGGDDTHKHTHWHCGVVSKRYLDKWDFKTYLKNVGRIDVDISKSSNFKHIQVYMNKPENKFPSIIVNLNL